MKLNSVSTVSIEHCVAIIGDSAISDDEMEQKILSIVNDKLTSQRLICWIPEAFGYVFISHFDGAQMPTSFSAKYLNGNWGQFDFKNEPIFTMTIPIAQHMSHNGPRNVFQKISMRSSLVNAVNNALNGGSAIKDCTLSGPALIDIPADIYLAKKPWYRLW